MYRNESILQLCDLSNPVYDAYKETICAYAALKCLGFAHEEMSLVFKKYPETPGVLGIVIRLEAQGIMYNYLGGYTEESATAAKKTWCEVAQLWDDTTEETRSLIYQESAVMKNSVKFVLSLIEKGFVLNADVEVSVNDTVEKMQN